MQGRYRGAEERARQRAIWRAEDVPGYMAAEVAPLARLLRRTEGLVAVDVGANKGFWSKAFLNSFPGAVERVHMIEPSPENHRELTRREDNLVFDADDFPHLSAHGFAVGAAPGRAALHTNEEGSPLASLYPHELHGFGEESWRLTGREEVEVDTLDDFLDRERIAFVDALKLDIEGHEFPALLGAEKALASRRIGAIAFEFGPHQVESRYFFKDFYKLLVPKGYDLFLRVRGSRVLEPVTRYDYRYEDHTRDNIFMASLQA